MSRARAVAVPRRTPSPRAPRRVSGPVARPRAVPGRPRPATPAVRNTGAFAARVRALPDARLLDRLLRSRAWIWLLGIGLGGIVFMQVSLLGMNAGIAGNVDRATTLQHANSALEESISTLGSGDRIQAAATKLGLVTPDAGTVTYLHVRRHADPSRAATNMTPPSQTAQETLATDGATTVDQAAAAAPATAAGPPPVATPVTTTPTIP